ncbi:hypothetical protein ACMAZF_16585 [Psychrobium sp. nBUS_13]|uniref:hypothetical protein n=1 Tax=Psychrobium sp. nBUS_13 TaxID=3395319 RepID=UPI003EBA6360
MKLLTTLLVLLLSIAFHAVASDEKGAGQGINNIDILTQYIDDYNQGRLDAMLTVMTADIQWMNIDSNKITTETKNKQQLAQALKPYLKGGNSTQSSLMHAFENGNFVSTLEKASWQSNGQMKSQCSIAIYEFDKNLIKNVWYHAAQSCD